jgi:superfamily II DNA/RNA helicase
MTFILFFSLCTFRRSGRTGRLGRGGKVISIISKPEQFVIKRFENELGMKVKLRILKPVVKKQHGKS